MLHTVLFSLFLVFYSVAVIGTRLENEKKKISTQCKGLIIDYSTGICLQILNSAIYVLICYISVQFCKPLDGQW